MCLCVISLLVYLFVYLFSYLLNHYVFIYLLQEINTNPHDSGLLVLAPLPPSFLLPPTAELANKKGKAIKQQMHNLKNSALIITN